ncbi:hypothetical protein BO85DRAFT_435871 [Aspergillus piperis CBS 112811]|uniref:Uncharacterized protein n=1 Tax=Aspergillus piperis CBS 112811 TaxID=1448313 RepID=A0A8G1R630_9EURO|nr:hypothetical protein BO85DRAFT_435871 [Aspergillus piperis CBS 112811]RAH60189.1 hypothetical protein BO85DRAFT_435871 [Aspergillus piperis CBS 112811]
MFQSTFALNMHWHNVTQKFPQNNLHSPLPSSWTVTQKISGGLNKDPNRHTHLLMDEILSVISTPWCIIGASPASYRIKAQAGALCLINLYDIIRGESSRLFVAAAAYYAYYYYYNHNYNYQWTTSLVPLAEEEAKEEEEAEESFEITVFDEAHAAEPDL